MTLFEARFFCVTNDYTVWYLGRSGRKTNYSEEEIMSDQGYPFIEELFDELFFALSHNQCIPFTKNDRTQYRVFFDYQNESDTLIINLWTGHVEPKCEIISVKVLEPSENNRRNFVLKVPSYCFDLIKGSELYSDRRKLFLTLLNRYLTECKNEHQELLDGDRYLRFMLYRDDFPLAPYAYGYLRNIDSCIPDHKIALNNCSKDYLPCEMCTLHKANFIFIKKSKWINKELFTESDIILSH